jgi:uncharacterized protein YceH (UPF0502 family)
MSDEFDTAAPPVTELTKGQRRVLGVLVEKAFTTPEAYPLTPKGLTTGCNQKSNRHPITNYSEDDVLQYADELRGLGLVAIVHTESGRTERFRHYMRKRFQFTEAQLAIITELLLRGRQSIGDLRARASRMAPIDSLEDLREALRGLQGMNLVQADGPLERRGVEVDHNLYEPREGNLLAYREGADDDLDEEESTHEHTAERAPVHRQTSTADSDRLAAVERDLDRIRGENESLRDELSSLKEELAQLSAAVDRLQRDLGG